MKKKFSFFVQFNKAIFMPGDLLQFRVFAIDSETKMATPTAANVISILDQRRNAIMSFQNVTFKRGKYENSFQLSEKASLGIWYFRFTCENEVSAIETIFKNSIVTLNIFRMSKKSLKLLNTNFHYCKHQ